MRMILALIAAFACLAAPASARAETKPWSQGVPMERRAEAREHFQEGNRLVQVPLFANAAEKYKQAIEIWPHPAFFYNLTIAQINLVQPVEAYGSIQRALAYEGDGLGEDKLRQAREYERLLSEQLGHVDIACAEPDAELRLDGRVVFVGPGRYRGVVLPGEHQLVAEKAGYVTETRTLVLSPGQRVAERIAMRRPLRPVTERYMPAWIPWATLGASAAVFAGALYVDDRASSQLALFNDVFPGECPRGCPEEVAPDRTAEIDRAQGTRTNAVRLYVAGGIIAATGVTLLYLNRERVVQREQPGDIAAMPILGRGVAGVSARVRF
ncbi:conserved hypothetical protein [Haliangium ochraceum DSM 14365]|uniref:PEGA domain-containing protein n=2 Tax=Haliangium ochraceum TaxID=80816 RepID=D0LRY4_HALO1|nr:conserved hypothetical protein [Haliangium ochraceum DSM 14365]